jgi:hypothetical protein
MPSATVSQKTTQISQLKRPGKRKHELSFLKISMILVTKRKKLLQLQTRIAVLMTTTQITKWTQ